MILKKPYEDKNGKPVELIIIDEEWMKREYDMLASEIFQPIISKFGFELPPSSFVEFKCNKREHHSNWGWCRWWGRFRKMTLGEIEGDMYLDHGGKLDFPHLEKEYRGNARDKVPLEIRKMQIELRTSHYMLESVFEDVLVHEMVHAVVQWNHLWAGAEGGHQGWFKKLSDILNTEYSEMFHVQRYVHKDDNSELRLARRAVEQSERMNKAQSQMPTRDIYVVDVKFDGYCNIGNSNIQHAGFVFFNPQEAQYFVNKIWQQQNDEDDASYAHVIPDAMESAYRKDDGNFLVYVDDMTIYKFVPSESQTTNAAFMEAVKLLPKPSIDVNGEYIDSYDLHVKPTHIRGFKKFESFLEWMDIERERNSRHTAAMNSVCIKKLGEDGTLEEGIEPDSFKALSSISESMFGQAGGYIMQKVRRLAAIIKRSLFSDNGGQRIIRENPDGSYEIEGWIS